MKKQTRHLSFVLAVLMVIGMLAAFPATAKQALPDVSTMATLINVAGSATYKGSDMTNGVGNYGEANWDVYHTGKLNDGVIATDATNNTTGKNVETHINGYVAGTTYVTFKLAKSERVSAVDVYTNCRTTGGNRGYPASVKVYVGNSEDVASATLLGEATTTDTGYIRKYTATGELSGEYVIIELGIITPTIVIALTEVEITAIQSPADVRMNHAPNGKYRGTGETNGKQNFGEDNWDKFSAGKLNDGVIANDKTDNTQGQNVEIQNPEYAKGGTFYLFFAFSYEVRVSDLSLFFNARDSYGRGYPTSVKAYVNGDDRLYDATYIGELTYTAPAGQDAPWVREYKCTCEGTESGTFVIFEMTMDDSTIGIGLTEVEIYGYGAPITYPLSTPKINEASDTPVQTFDAPTISWDKVSMAQGYDIYIDGVKVVENWQSTSYTVSAEPSDAYNSATAYSQIQVVAKGDYFWYTDSARSESYKYFYCKKPVDSNGNPVTEADFIIDPGHGGSQPGAINGERNEKDDTLAMSLKVGSMLEELGYTVAYTRITDVNVGLMARAIQGNVGNFKAFICIHRNSFTAEAANGVETLHQTSDANDEAFAQLVQDELMALGLFTNRGLKPRDNLVVLNNTKSTLPTILVELAFISNTNDNTLFDEYNDDIAFAIAKGAMAQIENAVEFKGTAKVNDVEKEVNNAAVEFDGIVLNDYENGYTIPLELSVSHTFGISGLQYTLDGEEWTDFSLSEQQLVDGKIDLRTILDALELEAGDYTLQFRIVHDHVPYKVYTATDVVAKISFTIEGETLCGDFNLDGVVDVIDAALILKHAADIDIGEVTSRMLYAGDVDGDGFVTESDAAAILKYAAGLVNSLPIIPE